MSKETLPHRVPPDMRAALQAVPFVEAKWNTLTPLARNEWICWVISVKKEETRIKHLKRLQEDIAHGKRRPCCFAGCPHRKTRSGN